MADEETTAQEPVCTCNDEYQIAPCPIHGVKGDATTEPVYGNNHNVVTDAELTSQILQWFSGYRFVCPVCGQDSIMHYFNHCPNCGAKIIVHSHFVTQAMRQINAKQK